MATILTKRSNTAASVPLAAQLTNSSLGAELAVNTADKRLFTKDGSGNVVELGTNPSTLGLPNGTANGVAYLNGSKVLTTGSALVFDGTNLLVGSSSAGFSQAGRGLVEINGSSKAFLALKNGDSTSNSAYVEKDADGMNVWNRANSYMRFGTNDTERARLDASGNLGLGVTPSAWNSGYKVAEIGKSGSSVFAGTSSGNVIVASNAYLNASDAWTYANNGGAAYFGVRNSDRSFVWNISSTGSGTAGNAISFTQAMTLDASGNLGVGTSSPFSVNGKNIEVSATNYARLHLVSTTGSGRRYWIDSNGDDGSFNITDGTASVVRARIDSSGNLLVGTTSTDPISSNVNGIAFTPSTGYSQLIHKVNGTAIAVGRSGTGTGLIDFYFRGGSVVQTGSISTNGTTTSFNTSSDYRLKENVQPMTGALAKVTALKPCTYTWKADGSAGEGFIAHELQEVCPDAVTGEKDAVNEDGSIKPQGIDTSFLVATLTAAIQELKAEVDALKAQLASDGPSSEA